MFIPRGLFKENKMKELIEIQSRLNAPKSRFNKFGGYNYRSCEDILEGVKPLLKEQKCTLTITDEVVLIGDRYYIKATATLTTSEGVSVTNTAYAREEVSKKGIDGAQVTGSASSYARKYALNGLFCIDDAQDSDQADPQEEKEKKSKEWAEAEPKIARQLKEVKTIAELRGLFNSYPQFNEISEFKQAFNQMRAIIKQREDETTKAK